MSKYTQQDVIEENGTKLLKDTLDTNFFVINDFSSTAAKDKYPDIDGQIRLRDGNGNYLNRYLHYQLKSKQMIKNASYHCHRKILDYLLDTNVPTLLFVADVGKQRVYWYYLDTKKKKTLGLTRDKKGRTLDLRGFEIANNTVQLNRQWQAVAKSDNYDQQNDSLKKIVSDFHNNVIKCVGLLYLLQKVPKKQLPDLFNRILKVSNEEVRLIVQRLNEESIINSTVNLYVLQNEQLGIESLFQLLGDLDFELLDAMFPDELDKSIILRQLAKIRHPNVDSYFKAFTASVQAICEKPTTNDEVYSNLELLKEYSHRVPKETIAAVGTIIRSKHPLNPVIHVRSRLGRIKGKSHTALVLKCLELLDDIRYLEIKSVFPFLVQLASYPDDAVQSKSREVLKNLSQFNLFVLQKISYYPQGYLIDTFDKWSAKILALKSDNVIVVAEQLLQPSFEGHSMSDYKTFTIHQGPLIVNDDLKGIRRRTLNILKKMFLNTQDVQTKRQILQTMQGASQTPYQGDYGDDLKQMVIDDTNWLIDFYLKILPTASLEVIKQLEEQIHWFHRRFGQERHPRLTELKSAIEVNSEYDMFRVFVGYEYRIHEELDWKEADRVRREKIQSFVDTLSPGNYPEWCQKILSVRSNYTSSDIGEFQYFGLFLFELGKQKPNIGLRLIFDNEKQLEPFLLHLLAGIWKSSLADRAKEIVSGWIAEGKYLSICAYIFDYIQEIDIGILQRVFVAASKNKDVTALYNIIGSIARNYDGSRTLRSLFMNTIKQFTKNHSFTWVNNLWFRHSSILENLDEKDFDLILKNLLLAPRIDYHSEEILSTIATKHPKKIINFFKNRVAIKASRKDVEERYEAIPFTLHKLNISLQKHVKIVVREIFEWISSKNWLLEWEGSRFIQKIFSTFDPELEKELISLLKSGTSQDAEIVLRVLRGYEGEPFLHNTCKELIKQHPKDEKYHKEMFIVLSQTGVVSGEYGFVEAYTQKKDEVQGWKQDKSLAVRDFASQYETYLDKLIAYEQKKADEDIELRKRDLR